MTIGKGVITGLGIASLLIALPAGAWGSKQSSQSSGSSGATSASATEGSSSAGQAGSKMGSESGGPGATGGAMAGGTASAGAAGEQHLTGKVAKVDQSKNQITLQLKVDESTQVMKDGKTASLSDIKEGDQVRASFRGDQVERIEVMSSGAGGMEREPSPSGGATQPGGSSTAPGGGSSGSSPGRGY